MMRHPDPIPTDGRSLDEIEADIAALLGSGANIAEIRLLAGELNPPVTFRVADVQTGDPVDIEVTRLKPGSRVAGALVV